MAWCPKCRGEFRDGFDTCPVCGVPLVERLAPERPAPAEDAPEPVLLANFSAPQELGAALDLLSQEDIPCLTRDPGSGIYLRVLTGSSVLGTDLYVEPGDYDRAVSALAAMDGEAAPCGEDELNAAVEAYERAGAEPEPDAPPAGGPLKLLWVLLAAIAVFVLAVFLAKK